MFCVEKCSRKGGKGERGKDASSKFVETIIIPEKQPPELMHAPIQNRTDE